MGGSWRVLLVHGLDWQGRRRYWDQAKEGGQSMFSGIHTLPDCRSTVQAQEMIKSVNGKSPMREHLWKATLDRLFSSCNLRSRQVLLFISTLQLRTLSSEG